MIVLKTVLNSKPDPAGLIWTLVMVLSISISSLWFFQLPESYQISLISSRQTSLVERNFLQLLISPLVHADIAHALSNLFALALYSYFSFAYLTKKIETSAFGLLLTWYALTVITQIISLLSYSDQVRLLGASGGVFIMMGFWLGCYILIAQNYSLRGRILRGLGISILSLVPASFEPRVSYRTHWIGICVGLLWGMIFYFLKRPSIQIHELHAQPEPMEQI